MDQNDVYAFSSGDEGPDDPNGQLNPAAEALLTRCNALLGEVESFQRSLRRAKVERTVELRLFMNQVKAEQRAIQGLCLEDPDSAKSRHGVKACNLPYLEALWGAAKGTTGITALCKTFHIKEKEIHVADQANDGVKIVRKKSSATVDVVAQNGLQWIKLSLITPRRLLFDIAKAGWEDGVSSSDEEDTPPPSSTAPLATSTLALTKLASTLLLAASQQRVQYLNPTVYFLFPNLPPPSDAEPEVRAFVDELTALGIHVQCGPPASDGNSIFAPRTIPELVTSLSSPLHRRVTSVTNPINLDTTILLAIISDVSNCTSVEVEHHIHPAIANQLEFEKTEPMLTTHLWPVMEGRDLVCTEVAAKRFWEIVKTMASAKEAERAELLMNRTESGDNLRRFAELCMHPLPEKGLHLPVYVLEEDSLEDSKEEVMKRVGAKLSAVNRGAFMGGWRAGLTTVTSNRAVAKIIASQVHDNEVGPDLYVVESARSLVGKAKKIKV